MDGTVVVALADSLQKVLQAKPHGFIIAGLAFASSEKGLSTTTSNSSKNINKINNGDSDALISAGADNACKYTPIVHQNFVNTRLIALLLSLLVLIIALFLKILL